MREIERLVSGRRAGDRPSDPASDEARRHVLRFDVSAETLATFRAAMTKLRRESAGPIDDDAALLLMARAVLGGPADDGRASYQIAMTVCERCRAGAQQAKGEAIAVEPAIVEMAECDAQRVAGDRATQTIPPAIRRKVLQRHHGGCAVPGCRNAVFVDVHHVDPRADGGTHDADKLVALCSAHHRALHRGRLGVGGDARAGFSFRHADVSSYGMPASPAAADATARAFAALRKLGFRETETRRALAHVGAGESTEAIVRAALAVLTASAA